MTGERSRAASAAARGSAVDVVIPFSGSFAALEQLLARLGPIAACRSYDSITVADNRPAGPDAPAPSVPAGVLLVRAAERQSSYHARNVAAARGDAPWILFVDADVDFTASLPDAYLSPPPGEDVGVLAGGIRDAPLDDGRRASLAERYSVEVATMSDARTLRTRERPPYAQTANALVRRAAFEAVGGFEPSIRSGGDADLCWRIVAAGWRLEARPRAEVTHRNRRSLTALLSQKARHGAGAAWLERRHPGTFPNRRLPGLALWSLRRLAAGAPSGGRELAAVDVAAVWAFELGRRRGNEAPVRGTRS